MLATAILTGGREADLFAATDAGLVPEVTTTHVRGSGTLPAPDLPGVPGAGGAPRKGATTRIEAGVALTLLRLLTVGPTAGDGNFTLTGTWPDQATPVLLATAHPAP